MTCPSTQDPAAAKAVARSAAWADRLLARVDIRLSAAQDPVAATAYLATLLRDTGEPDAVARLAAYLLVRALAGPAPDEQIERVPV